MDNTTTTNSSNNPAQTRATLLTKPLLILDGGLGTTLEQPPYNIHFSSEHTPLWSSHLLVSNPDTLRSIHASFVSQGGADVILTATYQASFEGFSLTQDGPSADTNSSGNVVGEEAAKRCMRNSVALARAAFLSSSARESSEGLVALSLGAYGATLIPGAEYSGAYGDRPTEGLETWHRNRLQVFSQHKETWEQVDIVAFETLPRVDEVRAVRAVMGKLEQGREKPWWVCCVFPGEVDEEGGGGVRLPDGSQVAEVVQAMLGGEGMKPWGIGLNCTKIWKVRNLILAFEAAVTQGNYGWQPRLVLYPDGAGDLVYDVVKQVWTRKEGGGGQGREGKSENKSWDEEVAEIVSEVQSRGVWTSVVVGGCCKTGPEHIGALSRRLKQR